MNKVKISLAKALKLKSRLTGRLVKVNSDIYQNNSRLEGQDTLNVQELVVLRSKLVNALVDLKSALFKGNLEIQERLYVLAELKSEIAFLNGMPTKHGKEMHGYQNTPIMYVAQITKPEVDKQIKELESSIDRRQEEIDEYNYSTKIEVYQSVLDLAS